MLRPARSPAASLISERLEGLLQLCVHAATEKLQRSNFTTMTPWLPSTVATISSHYFRECIKGAERKGIDVNGCCRLRASTGQFSMILALAVIRLPWPISCSGFGTPWTMSSWASRNTAQRSACLD